MAAPNKFLSVLAANQSSIRNFDALRMDKLEQVRQTGTVFSSAAGTVCQAASSRWLELANANGAIAAIIADERLEQSASTIGVNKPIILTASPEKLFLEAHLAGIHDSRDANIPFSKIHPTAVLLGDVVLGDDVDIGPNVSIVGPVRIGAKTRIEPNCVVGAEGLFAKKLGDELIHVPHFGGVSIGERCVVHAGAVIVRSAFAD
ncbi:MAG TPA: DapH/DapD/GlmU-related protein, partial [Afipia sp.]